MDQDSARHDGGGTAAKGGDARLSARVIELGALYRLTDRLYRASDLSETFDAALDAITVALRCERASILLFDDAGVMRFVASRGLSEGYRRTLDGHSPWRPGELDPDPIFVEDIEDTAETDEVKRTIRAEGIRALGFIPLVARGVVIGKFMLYHAERHDFSGHEAELAVNIARQLGFSLERARTDEARRRVEAQLRESEERFRLMSESAPVMIWVSKPDGHCLHLNRMLREFWSIPEDGVEGFDWTDTMHPEDAPEVMRAMSSALAGRHPVQVEGRYRSAGGDYRVLATDARPRFSASGEFLGMIGVNVDVTERKQSESQLQLLLAELNHRVKNMLAVVQAMARQTFRNTASLPEARKTFDGRLTALAVAHDLLTRANWDSAPLQQIARDTLQLRADRQRIAISGPPVLLTPKQTLAVTLALHELYTNALKYGALATETGRIGVDWTLTDEPVRRLSVVWREEGARSSGPPERKGFGTRLIEQLVARDLGGEIAMDFRPEGLCCTLDLPLG